MATAFGMTADKLRDLLLDPSTDPLLIQKLLNRWYDLAATTPQEASDEQTTEGNRQPNADSDAAGQDTSVAIFSADPDAALVSSLPSDAAASDSPLTT